MTDPDLTMCCIKKKIVISSLQRYLDRLPPAPNTKKYSTPSLTRPMQPHCCKCSSGNPQYSRGLNILKIFTLGYKAYYLILVPVWCLIFRLSYFQISVRDNYLLTILSAFWQSLILRLTDGLDNVHRCLL